MLDTIMSITLRHQDHSVEIDSKSNQNIASTIFLSGHIPLRPLCAGIGHCGKCRIRFHSPAPLITPTERLLLSKEEQEDNIRLACKHQTQNMMDIELLDTITSPKNIQTKIQANSTTIQKVYLAIDLGTTSIAWQCAPILEDNDSKMQFPSGQALNPQMIAGSDIMARLASHHKHALYLQTLIKEHIQDICTSLHHANYQVEEIYLAANPAMLAIAIGTDTSGLCAAPYHLDDTGNRYVQLENLPPVWIPSQMGPFVGADACAGFAYILIKEKMETKKNSFILADMGTNGEFIRYTHNEHNTQKLFGVSVPLGPALEGVGMRCGGPVLAGMEGVILKFNLSPNGLEYTSNSKPTHICGVAYLGLIHILLSVGIIDRQGHFQNSTLPLARKMMQKLHKVNGETRFAINDDLYLCSEDIENILKVKAAFASALRILMTNTNIDHIFLAGSLSEYIPIDHLTSLDFIPKSHAEKIHTIGNSSLKGLLALIHRPDIKKTIATLVHDATVIDLPSQTDFTQTFIDEMHF